MVKRDLNKSAERFQRALRRTVFGLERQRQRVVDFADSSPKIQAGDIEVINLGSDPGYDLDYYIYELARLKAIGHSATKVFGQPSELLGAAKTFDDGIPGLRDIRNPLTHPNDNDELDEVAWFSAVVKLKPGGGVQHIVDPRYQHHDIALAYATVLTDYLGKVIKDGIAADPPRPLKEQIQRDSRR